MSKKLTLNKIIFTFFLFIVIWSIRITLLKPYIDTHYVFWSRQLINSSIKTLIWFGFALYFIKKYDSQLKISFKEMFTTKIMGKIFFPLLILFVVYHLIGMFLTFGKFQINPSFHPSQLISQFLVVGILEEIVFRGWFMNALSSFVSEKKANIISAMFFIVIHYPSYIVGGTFQFPSIIMVSLFIFILGIIFGWTFRKNRSLWTPVILHMIWDLLSITLM